MGIVQECCDPRRGLAKVREFPPTVAAVVEWCDRRHSYHKAMAAYQERVKPPEIVETQMTEAQQVSFTKSLHELLARMRKSFAPAPKTPRQHLVMPDSILSMTVSPSLEEIVRAKGWVK